MFPEITSSFFRQQCVTAACCPLALDVPLPFTRRNFLLFAQHWPQDPTGCKYTIDVFSFSLLPPCSFLWCYHSGRVPAAGSLWIFQMHENVSPIKENPCLLCCSCRLLQTEKGNHVVFYLPGSFKTLITLNLGRFYLEFICYSLWNMTKRVL